MVAEILAESAARVSFKRIGLPGEFPKSVGSQQFLRERFGLSPEKIALSVVNELAGISVQRNVLKTAVVESHYE
jgi:transketolase C-terminal domain/subunit